MAPRTIQSVIDALGAAVPGGLPAATVDTLKAGDAQREVARVAVCFMATLEVLEQAAARGANLVITHEPTFYGHHDRVDWLEGDPVYAAKRAFIEAHGLVVWRFHDGPHRLRPDGILMGMRAALGWNDAPDPAQPAVCRIPPTPLGVLAATLGRTLGVAAVRVVGDDAMPCSTVGLMPGAPGGASQMRFLQAMPVDVLVTGEIAEWETSEYVRDACRSGQARGLIVLGHAASEEAGMRALIPWMQALVPGVAFEFVATAGALHWVGAA